MFLEETPVIVSFHREYLKVFQGQLNSINRDIHSCFHQSWLNDILAATTKPSESLLLLLSITDVQRKKKNWCISLGGGCGGWNMDGKVIYRYNIAKILFKVSQKASLNLISIKPYEHFYIQRGELL